MHPQYLQYACNKSCQSLWPFCFRNGVQWIIAWCWQVTSEALKTEFFTWPFLASQEACSWSCVFFEREKLFCRRKSSWNISSLKASLAGDFSRKGWIVSGFHPAWPITHSELLPSVAERAGKAVTPDPNRVTVNRDPFGNPEQMFASTAHQQVTMGRGCHQVLVSFCTCHSSILDLLLTVMLLCVFCCHSWTQTLAALRAFRSINHQNSLRGWEKGCISSGPR